ncbi:unnamed protein product [Rhizophagus irregularis]|nr:unnamed protein product [Rhizophagus irregularis]
MNLSNNAKRNCHFRQKSATCSNIKIHELVHNESVRKLDEPSSPSTSQEASSISSSKQPEHPSGELSSKVAINSK